MHIQLNEMPVPQDRRATEVLLCQTKRGDTVMTSVDATRMNPSLYVGWTEVPTLVPPIRRVRVVGETNGMASAYQPDLVHELFLDDDWLHVAYLGREGTPLVEVPARLDQFTPAVSVAVFRRMMRNLITIADQLGITLEEKA